MIFRFQTDRPSRRPRSTRSRPRTRCRSIWAGASAERVCDNEARNVPRRPHGSRSRPRTHCRLLWVSVPEKDHGSNQSRPDAIFHMRLSSRKESGKSHYEAKYVPRRPHGSRSRPRTRCRPIWVSVLGPREALGSNPFRPGGRIQLTQARLVKKKAKQSL